MAKILLAKYVLTRKNKLYLSPSALMWLTN